MSNHYSNDYFTDNWAKIAPELSPHDVGDFLRSIKLDKYVEEFISEGVDGKMLASIVTHTKKDVLECLGVKSALHIEKIYTNFSSFCLSHSR